MLSLDDDARHNTRQREEGGQLQAIVAELLVEALRRFFGTAAVELSVQDGTIQLIRRTVERMEK